MEEPKVEDSLPQVVDQLNENERLVVELETDWQDKVQCSKEFITEKVVELEGLGTGNVMQLWPENLTRNLL